jgi:transcriptional regulator with XRE-family HTH domain
MSPAKPRSRSSHVSTSAGRVRGHKALPLNTQLEKRLHAAVCRYGNNYELAAAAGLSADMLSRFARRERNLRLDSAGKLAQALGLTLIDE